jgi:hypothetical protein
MVENKEDGSFNKEPMGVFLTSLFNLPLNSIFIRTHAEFG